MFVQLINSIFSSSDLWIFWKTSCSGCAQTFLLRTKMMSAWYGPEGESTRKINKCWDFLPFIVVEDEKQTAQDDSIWNLHQSILSICYLVTRWWAENKNLTFEGQTLIEFKHIISIRSNPLSKRFHSFRDENHHLFTLVFIFQYGACPVSLLSQNMKPVREWENEFLMTF